MNGIFERKRLSFPILAGIFVLVIAGIASAGAYYFHTTKIDSVKVLLMNKYRN